MFNQVILCRCVCFSTTVPSHVENNRPGDDTDAVTHKGAIRYVPSYVKLRRSAAVPMCRLMDSPHMQQYPSYMLNVR